MMRSIIVGLTLVALAGCGNTAAAPVTATAPPVTVTAPATRSTASTPPAAATPPASTSTPEAKASTPNSDKPLSYYAAQYEKIVAPANKALDAFKALPDSAPMSADQKAATATANADLVMDNELLRAQWPNEQTTQDVRALVTADTALGADLTDLTLSLGSIAHDAGTENGAVAIVRADLGLPAIPPS